MRNQNRINLRSGQQASTTHKKYALLTSSKGDKLDRRLYLVGLVILLLGILIKQPILLIGGSLLTLILGITDLWSHFSLHNLAYQREISEQRLLFGEEVMLDLTVENIKLLPLPWLELEERLPRDLTLKEQKVRTGSSSYQVTLNALFHLSWYERVTRRYTLQGTTRGIHIFGPTTLHSGDGFGFLKREGHLNNEQFILVYPLILPLTSFHLPARHPFGDHRSQQRLIEDPSRVVGVREYAYGDSLRRVDWKATARTLTMQSKIYESTTTYTIAIFLNVTLQLDVHYGFYPELRELCISAAASIADWSINQGYAVGLYVNTVPYQPEEKPWKLNQSPEQILRERRIRIPAASTEEQRTRILEMLARIQNTQGCTLDELILSERSNLLAGTTALIITSTINEKLLDAILHLRRHGNAVALLYAGEQPSLLKMAGVTVYHIGTTETWKQCVRTSLQESSPLERPTFQF
ncbi:DUF58 domain-containing protein [Tengunoibacter tsumagoiensis]|uniref:DUF58 domain-containing protein n=1 Tax=Tengunoibacter tsumagoiensis TaxID=2014871 RepID=A0A401ZTL4_9CHLR|nr:DUF58 domain-containing protein [Tengunoibacter tsumagoiensis]GCE10239.1 hypothetical protein KTT_00980 [Tengunoibacter tsumagoiensis]